jgi:hypothetical protein
MTNRLKRRREYLRSREDLSLSARLRLQAAELGIVDDPDHRENRIDTVLGGRSVVVEGNGSLVIYFHRLDAGVVSMDLVVDLEDPPDWYSQPTGTWFELMEPD